MEPDRHDLRLTTSNAEKSATILPAPTEDDAQLSRQDTEAIYAKFSPNRKRLVTAVVACGGISSTVSTLLLLAAIPEIAGEFNTSGSIINVSNAIYTVFMGISTLFWGPVSQVYGRKWVGSWAKKCRGALTNLTSHVFYLQLGSLGSPWERHWLLTLPPSSFSGCCQPSREQLTSY